MSPRALVAASMLLGAATPAQAQGAPAVLSPGPERVGVTLYRDPDRGDRAIDRDSPSAFALITEVRTVTLPPGVATVRFEGVASGIVPQSAILFGTDAAERNRDTALLSQAGLVDGFTGQQVTLRRTDPATGASVAERATIRSAADRLIVQTARGAEAVYCTGLAQTLIYPDAPATLSAKPVLTMTTHDQPGGTASVTLAYIATGFDWDATYVGTLADDGSTLELSAWLTMASADDTSFVDATTSAVAGRVARAEDTRDDAARAAIATASSLDRTAGCWPAGTTSDVPSTDILAPPPAPAPVMMEMSDGDIVVTGSRVALRSAQIAVTAQAEPLADLKLYRIPVPVTVAARSQKQVAFLAGRRVAGTLLHRSRVSCCDPDDPELLYRFRNDAGSGLGEPLPAGGVILYQAAAGERRFVGETTLPDKASGEEVELVLGEERGVSVESDETGIPGGRRYGVTIRNANPVPVRYELEFANDADTVVRGLRGLITKPGKRVWATTLAPNSETRVRYDMITRD